ncbi:hypothetical protein MCBG_04146 [Micromonospora sp. M42]|nr:hypothetical protein MCBG_04146 [Micromonospora sp. M42]
MSARLLGERPDSPRYPGSCICGVLPVSVSVRTREESLWFSRLNNRWHPPDRSCPVPVAPFGRT